MVTEPIRDKKMLRLFADYWLKQGNLRNYVLIVLGVYTALRVGDLLRLVWDDVYDAQCGKFHTHITLIEQKTGKYKVVALNNQAVNALNLYLPNSRGNFIFASSRKDGRAISRIQAWRIIRTAAEAVDLTGHVGCHSLRKTFGYFAWRNGTLPVVLMDIYNHSSYEVTRRYLGISQDDRDKVYTGMVLF